MLTSDLLKPAPASTITVEYDSRNGRATKTFAGPKCGYEARSFYVRKSKEGKNPKVLSAKAGETTMAKKTNTEATPVVETTETTPVTETPKVKEATAEKPNGGIRWTPIKCTLMNALRKAGGISASSAVTAEEVEKASAGKITADVVRRQCNNHFCLIVGEVVGKAQTADGAVGIYLTKKGLKALEKEINKK